MEAMAVEDEAYSPASKQKKLALKKKVTGTNNKEEDQKKVESPKKNGN